MRRTVLLRALVALAILVAARVSRIVATEQSAATMTDAAGAFVDSLATEQRRLACSRTPTPSACAGTSSRTRCFPARGSPSERCRPRRAQGARAAQVGPQPEGVSDRHGNHRARGHAARHREQPPVCALAARLPVHGVRHAGARGAWGWRVEGHHLSLHFAVANGRVVATSPTFTGANPAEVKDGPRRACGCWRRSKTPAARWSNRCPPSSAPRR